MWRTNKKGQHYKVGNSGVKGVKSSAFSEGKAEHKYLKRNESDHCKSCGRVHGNLVNGMCPDCRFINTSDGINNDGKMNVKLHVSYRGSRGTQFTFETSGGQLVDVGVYKNVQNKGVIDRIKREIKDQAYATSINSNDDLRRFRNNVQRIVEKEIVKEGYKPV